MTGPSPTTAPSVLRAATVTPEQMVKMTTCRQGQPARRGRRRTARTLLGRIARSLERLVDEVSRRPPAMAAALGPAPALGPGAALAPSDAVVRFLERIADAVAPAPADLIGTPEIARRLGCSTVWVAELARNGEMPAACIVPGSGNGKPWKFYRAKVEAWLQARGRPTGP